MVKTARTRQFSGIFPQKKKGTKTKVLNENNGIVNDVFGKPGEQVKRLAESPQETEAPTRKRSAFGDITNAVYNKTGGKSKGKAAVRKNSDGVRKEKKATERKTRSSAAFPDLEILSSSSEVSSSQESTESSIDVVIVSDSEVEVETDSQNSSSSDSSNTEVEVTDIQASMDSSCEIIMKSPKKKLMSPKRVPTGVVDIDADKLDHFLVSEYAEEIFLNMRGREDMFPLKFYMDKQKELTENMRAILVDWLVEVQESFELYHETLYLGVRILDHHLMTCYVERENLQLVGATSLFIACKIEERHAPCLDDFLYICDDAYQQSSFVAMEKKILNSLEFDINIPIPYRFLRRFARAASADVKTLTLSRFILETTLHHYKFTERKPSFLAAACLHLALRMKNRAEWTPTLVHYTGYTSEQLRDCVIELNNMISEPPKKSLMTVRNKYSHAVFHEVANITPLDSASL